MVKTEVVVFVDEEEVMFPGFSFSLALCTRRERSTVSSSAIDYCEGLRVRQPRERRDARPFDHKLGSGDLGLDKRLSTRSELSL